MGTIADSDTDAVDDRSHSDPASNLKNSPGRALSRFSALVAPIRRPLTIAVILQAVGAAAGVVPFVAIVEIVRALLPVLSDQPVDAGRAWTAVWVAAAALFVRLVSTWSAGMITHFADATLAHRLRTGIVEHLSRLPLGWFSATSSGKVRKAAQEDVQTMHHLVAHALLDATTAVVVPTVSVVYLFVVQWRMALICLIPVALAVGLYWWAMRDAMPKYGRYEASLGELNAAMVEFVSGISVVKMFNQTGRAHARFRRTADDFADFFDGWVRESTRISAWMEFVSAPVAVLTMITVPGTALVASGVIPVIDLLPALLLGLGLATPLMSLGFSFQSLREGRLAAISIEALLALPVLPEPMRSRTPENGRVELDTVDFSYDGDVPAVRDVDLTLRPGTVTALVGPSGSGKSTVAKLVPRFFDPDSGRVLIGGADARDVASDELYRWIGFCFQDASLLRVSMRDNIRLGRPQAGDADVEKAARAALIHDRIMADPRGYDAVLGDDVQFSGGEEQRLAIARALLADAPILVLDEATAYADPDSEALIQEAISRLARGRTVLVVAHRLYTITGVDQIVVMQDGRAVERGTHAELLAGRGRYARVWDAHQRASRSPAVHHSNRADAPGKPTTSRAAGSIRLDGTLS